MKQFLLIACLLFSIAATAQQFEHHQIKEYFSSDIGVTPVVPGVAGTNVRANIIDLKNQLDAKVDSYATGVAVTGTTSKTVTITRNNGLPDLTTTFTDLSGSASDGVVTGASITGTTTKTITLTRSEGLSNIVITFQDNVNDADASSTNEINAFTRASNSNSVTGSNGGGTFSVLDAYHFAYLTVPPNQTYVQLPANPDLAQKTQFKRNGKQEPASKTQGTAYFFIDASNRIYAATGEVAFASGEIIYYEFPR